MLTSMKQVPLNLRFVPLARVLTHERNDPLRTRRLTTRIGKDAVLCNPPIVGKTKAGELLLLDGANRFQALEQLGAKHAFVQVVPYEAKDLDVRTWNHLLAGVKKAAFLEPLQLTVGQLLRVSQRDARKLLMRRSIVSLITFRDGTRYAVQSAKTLEESVGFLHRMSAHYVHAQRYRVQEEDMRELQRVYPRASVLIDYPEYTKHEILRVAREGLQLPSGITRFIMPNRALRVNVPLARLRSSEPTAMKDRWRKQELDRRVQKHAVRGYAEATYHFDD